ncbi:hypothetical protein D9M71_455710 [compost metagenome]
MNQVIIVVARSAEAAERKHQFAAINMGLHQLLAADRDAGVIDRCRHAQVGAIEGQAALGQCREQVVLFSPERPLCVISRMVPGQRIMQGCAMAQVLGALFQAVTPRIVGTAHGGQPFSHQAVAGQPRKLAIGVVQGQVDVAGAKVDIVIADPQVQRHQRVTLDEVRQPGHQPALGDRGPDIERDGARDFRLRGLLQRRGQFAHRRLQYVENALAFIGQADLPGQALEQLHVQRGLQPADAVAYGAGRQAQFLRGTGKTQMPRGDQEGMQVRELAAVEPGTDARRKVEHDGLPAI